MSDVDSLFVIYDRMGFPQGVGGTALAAHERKAVLTREEPWHAPYTVQRVRIVLEAKP